MGAGARFVTDIRLAAIVWRRIYATLPDMPSMWGLSFFCSRRLRLNKQDRKTTDSLP